MKFDVQNPAHLALAGGVAILAVYFIGRQAVAAVGGAISGNNALTENQTDMAGNRVDAYKGAGIPGTLGAAANTASGGVLATLGEHLGSWAFDIFGPKVDINAPQSKLDRVP
jgi:hypothetical protein